MSSEKTLKQSVNYNTLQSLLDSVIGKIGTERTHELLKTFLSNTPIEAEQEQKITMLTQYLISLATTAFDLLPQQFIISQVREYRDARMCCFHLLRKFTKCTYPKIGLSFQCSSRAVMYGCSEVEDRLAMPRNCPDFSRRYRSIESQLIVFISKID